MASTLTMLVRSLALSVVVTILAVGTDDALAWTADVPVTVPPRVTAGGPLLGSVQRIEVAEDGTIYLLSYAGGGTGFEGPTFAFEHVTSTIVVWRLDPNGTRAVLGSFPSFNEVGPPVYWQEPRNLPAGMALDESRDVLYVAVPGAGIRALDLPTGDWRTFVDDQHAVSGLTDFIERVQIYLPSAWRNTSWPGGPFNADQAYGRLWHRQPTVPAAMAVDPASGHLFVAEAAGTGGEGDVFFPGRRYAGPLRVREFAPSGGAQADYVGDVDLDASAYEGYPTPSGAGVALRRGDTLADIAVDTLNYNGITELPEPTGPWLLGFQGGDAEFDTTVANMRFVGPPSDRRLVIAGQLLKYVDGTGGIETNGFGTKFYTGAESTGMLGQAVVLKRGEGGALEVEQVARAVGTRLFGPNAGAGLGVQDLAETAAGDLVFPATSEPSGASVGPGLLVTDGEASPKAMIGRGGTGACEFTVGRARVAGHPTDGSIVVVEQPFRLASTTEPIRVHRLRPDGSGASPCLQRDLPPTQRPEIVLRAALVDDDGLVTPFTDIPQSGELEVPASDSNLDGVVLSATIIDPDNSSSGGVQDHGPLSSCRWRTPLLAGEERTTRRSEGGIGPNASRCRPRADGGELETTDVAPVASFTFVPAAAIGIGGRTARLEVIDDDDERTEARVLLRNPVDEQEPLVPKLAAALAPSSETAVRFRFDGTTGPLASWRITFGDGRSWPVDGGFAPAAEFPATGAFLTHDYAGPGTYTAGLTVRSADDVEATAETVITLRPPEGARGTVVPGTPAAGCTTPLGVPLGVLGLGDDRLCVPADPCDINPGELGLAQLGIQRPATCSGADADLREASEPGPPPTSARPVLVRRTLRLGTDGRISASIRCGSGPGTCAGRVRIQIPASGGAPSVTVGTATFTRVGPGVRRVVRVRASKTAARTLRRARRKQVRVTVTPSVQPGFSRPRTDTATVFLTASSSRAR